MKRQKQANFTELIGMIQREAAQRFQPSVPLIKKVIDILLEKNFIERKEDMRDTYVYVAWFTCSILRRQLVQFFLFCQGSVTIFFKLFKILAF